MTTAKHMVRYRSYARMADHLELGNTVRVYHLSVLMTQNKHTL